MFDCLHAGGRILADQVAPEFSARDHDVEDRLAAAVPNKPYPL
jgi:hypothetical protein